MDGTADTEGAGGTDGAGGTAGMGAVPPIDNPVDCDTSPTIGFAPSGLPLMQSNPGAPVALFLDFDGGVYLSSSSGDQPFVGYSNDADFSTFNTTEQQDIIRSFTFVARYFAMFDVNVTTDDAVRQATGKWGWILISEGASGGRGSLSRSAIGTPAGARSYVGSSTIRSSDRSRRVAHELGHNFTLEHSGVWDGATFYKWEDWPEWDGVYGTVMGGGGEGERNGWGYGAHSGDQFTDQDSMEIIRQRVLGVGGEGDGWREDDFADPTALCAGDGGELYREGILGSPGDQDSFLFDWPGGAITVEAQIPEVSAALLDLQVLPVEQDAMPVAGGGTTNLAVGRYELRVSSQGGYGEIGAYRVSVR